jgi:fused signal recognition particle receptor
MIVTKIDGSTRGGIALATERALQIPLKFVGVGEAITDLQRFEADRYIAELLT